MIVEYIISTQIQCLTFTLRRKYQLYILSYIIYSDGSSGAIPTRQIITQVRPLQQKVVTSVAAAASTGTQQQFIQQNIQSATGTQIRPATNVIRQQSGMYMYYVVCNSTYNQNQVFLDVCLLIQNSFFSYRDNLSFSREEKEILLNLWDAHS